MPATAPPPLDLRLSILRYCSWAPPLSSSPTSHPIEPLTFIPDRGGMDQSLLDDIINRLMEVRGWLGKQVQLLESEIRQLCVASKEIFLQQPNLLELEAPIKIYGT